MSASWTDLRIEIKSVHINLPEVNLGFLGQLHVMKLHLAPSFVPPRRGPSAHGVSSIPYSSTCTGQVGVRPKSHDVILKTIDKNYSAWQHAIKEYINYLPIMLDLIWQHYQR